MSPSTDVNCYTEMCRYSAPPRTMLPKYRRLSKRSRKDDLDEFEIGLLSKKACLICVISVAIHTIYPHPLFAALTVVYFVRTTLKTQMSPLVDMSHLVHYHFSVCRVYQSEPIPHSSVLLVSVKVLRV